MVTYDAKKIQVCMVCGYIFSHNKQGRFTTHLKNAHGLSLNDYLIKYYYNRSDLMCLYELCNKDVGLYRGIPKKYCSKSCSAKAVPLVCKWCGEKFEAKNRYTKTCNKMCAHKLKSQKTEKWHSEMSCEQKKQHFNNIIRKTSITRKKNNTPSWISGKTGVYSEETIEKIRIATLKQMENKSFHKTKIERIMERLLISLNVNYKYSFVLEKRQFDFLLIDLKIIIECDGDYWHANPRLYPKPEEWQKERIRIDEEKNRIAIGNGFTIIRFWEFDIHNNFELVKQKLASYIVC